MTTRREFLKTGLAGGLLLNLAACARPLENGGRTVVLNALIPVMLTGALPADGNARPELIARTRSGVERAIAGLAPASGRRGRKRRRPPSAIFSKAGATAASIFSNPATQPCTT